MHIETLKIFCDLVETKSFSKTAKLNYLTQSAVSQQIKQLEERFEKRLVERGVLTLRPTDAGEAFYKGCRDILDRYYQLEKLMTAESDVVAGSVKVSAIYSIGLHELAPFVKQFLRDFPNISLHVEYARANRIFDDVCSNMTDLGLVAAPVKGRRLLSMTPIYADRMVFTCHPKHPLAAKASVKAADLQDHPMVGFENDIPTRKLIDRELRKRGVKPDVVMEFDNVETLKGAVEINHGFSILPLPSVLREVASGTLVVKEIKDLHIIRPIYLMHRKDKIFPPAAQKFLDELNNSIRKLGPEEEKRGVVPVNAESLVDI